jgi:glycerol kinase
MYLLNKVPGLRADAENGDALFGTIDTFLIWKLTGGEGKHQTNYFITTPLIHQLLNKFSIICNVCNMCQINVGHAVHATDVSNASRTLMMDLGTVKWDEDVLLRAMGVPLCMLPEIRPSSEVLGRIKSEGDKSTGE